MIDSAISTHRNRGVSLRPCAARSADASPTSRPTRPAGAFRVDLADDPAPPEVVLYCPECAAREFGRESDD
jgi:hypothetical protein